MMYSYDSEADALYIDVAARQIDHQLELTDGVIVDVSSDGSLVGIDVMCPSAEWAWHPIAERFMLSESDASLLASLAAVRTWRASAGSGKSIPEASGHPERDLAVLVLAGAA